VTATCSEIPYALRAKGKEIKINQSGLDCARRMAKAIGGTLTTDSSNGDIRWMQKFYDDFRAVFKLASNGRCVKFS